MNTLLPAQRDSDALRTAVRRINTHAVAPVVFGGLGEATQVISESAGLRTRGLLGLRIEKRRGLGGLAASVGREYFVSDYRTSKTITHDYDLPVLAEGIASLLALPVRLFGKTRGLIYVGDRKIASISDRTLDLLREMVSDLEYEIKVRDEVQRRLAYADLVSPESDIVTLREIQADLRTLRSTVEDPVVRAQLESIGEKFTSHRPNLDRQLSRREVDVLSLVSLGCGNAEVAERLGLGVETVRGYLRNSMRKLNTHSRWEAVVVARRRGEMT